MNNYTAPLTKYANALSLTQGRKKILQFSELPPLAEFLSDFRAFGLELLAMPFELEKGEDCKKYVFNRIKKYCGKGFRDLRDRIYEKKHPFLVPQKKASEELIVGYFKNHTNLEYAHWGICMRHHGALVVESRWGINGKLFRHPLEIVPAMYGNFAEFLEVKKNID